MGKKRKKKKEDVTLMPSTDALSVMTGKNRLWWVSKVQELIARNTVPSKRFKGHGETDITGWTRDLVAEVMRNAPRQGQTIKSAYDGNMYAARVVGMILTLWAVRIRRAKSQDPRRPLQIRRAAYIETLNYVRDFIDQVFLDDTQDAVHFVGQKWNHPFFPGAKGGKFV